MADTGDKHYSKKESLNRILRVMEGSRATSDLNDNLQGTIFSEDEALSRIAELFENRLAGYYYHGPNTGSAP